MNNPTTPAQPAALPTAAEPPAAVELQPQPLRLSAVEKSMVRPDTAAAVAASRTGGHDA